MSDEEEKAKLKEYKRAYYLKNKEVIKARARAWEQAQKEGDPEFHAKTYAKRKAREAADPLKHAEARRRRSASAQAYYHRNREDILERLRTDEDVKTRYRERLNKWRKANPEKVRAQTARRADKAAEYRERNKERIRLRYLATRVLKPKGPVIGPKESARRSYERNRPMRLEKARLRRERNPDYHTAYTRGRYRTDPQYKLSHLLRIRISSAIKHGLKSGSAVRDHGCTIPELMVYIATLFKPGMSWDNSGEWHLDHKKPLVLFDLTDRAQFLEAAHYTNLQPLWAEENLRKHAKYHVGE